MGIISFSDRIKKLSNKKTELMKLEEELAELSAPIISDHSRIPELYEWYNSAYGIGQAESIRKKYFTFIAVMLYSPNSIIGGRLPNGLRDELACVMGYDSPSAISNNINIMKAWYNTYETQRKEVDTAFSEIYQRIRKE